MAGDKAETILDHLRYFLGARIGYTFQYNISSTFLQLVFTTRNLFPDLPAINVRSFSINIRDLAREADYLINSFYKGRVPSQMSKISPSSNADPEGILSSSTRYVSILDKSLSLVTSFASLLNEKRRCNRGKQFRMDNHHSNGDGRACPSVCVGGSFQRNCSWMEFLIWGLKRTLKTSWRLLWT